MPFADLVPASFTLVDGVPYADAYGDVYHSADGGLAQARHVFLGGNDLPQRWRGRETFTILETGFGLGLNFLATWKTWREDAERPCRLHYLAIEKHPFKREDLARLYALWPELGDLSRELCAAWPPLLPGFHRLLLDEGRVTLTVVFADVADALPQIDARADAFYLDGFAPGKNPDMWAPPLLQRLNRLAAPDATLASYTVSAAVRRALAQAGFACEKRPGFGRKREMLAARFAPRWSLPPFRPAYRPPAERHAIVIGAGIAGSAACERLAARGWRLTLVERHAAPAQEASGNLAGIVMPLLSRDDNLASQLARAAYLFAPRVWRAIGGIGQAFAGEACGVLQLASDPEHASLQREAAARHAYPPEFAQWLEPLESSRLLRGAPSHGGWLFPQGGWVHPGGLCDALLKACGDRLERRFTHLALQLEREDGQWRVRDASNAVIAEAPVVILANGTHAGMFSQTKDLPLTAIRGQVTHLPATALPELPVVVCGEGYLTRPMQGTCSIGASYDADDEMQLRRTSQEENIGRLRQLLPDAAVGLQDVPLAGRVGFRCVSEDRLPLAGALPSGASIAGSRLRDVPREPGVHVLLAYGSRGLIWAPLAAELLAAQLEGEPLPVEQELAAALDPARFALKAWRRGTASTTISGSEAHA